MAGGKAKTLLVGGGGVGTMAAYALETGGKASVTAVLRSNYDSVMRNGFEIDSIDHGLGIKGFRPSSITKKVPDVASGQTKFDYVVVTTKNVPDVKPTVTDIIAPAITPGHTSILLLQNGINIEKPLTKRFPTNPILSGISMIAATEYEKGKVRHDDKDILLVGAFENPNIPNNAARAAAKRFVDLYNACGKVDCRYDEDVLASRWRKLVYNSCYNTIATILRMDTVRMRVYNFIIDDLVRPCMLEIRDIAKAAGVSIDDKYIEKIINVDPIDTYFKPSMQQDIEKGNYVEYENIVGEPLKEARRLGVPAPTLTIVYAILKGLQTKVMEEKGLVKPVFTEESKYRKM